MSPSEPVSGATMLVLLAGLVGLVTVIVVATRLARLLPLRRVWRRRLERWTPLVGSILAVIYLGWSVVLLLRGRGLPAYAVLLLGLVLLAVAWSGLRDVVAGVVWRASRPWLLGDPIRVGEVQGRISSLGYRAVVVETDRGEQSLVPYSLLLRLAVTLRGKAAGDVPHQFTVALPVGTDVDRVRQRLQRALGLCHGASVLREPWVRPTADDAVEVTVFVLSADFASRVEACARRCVAACGPEDGPPSSPDSTAQNR